MKEIHISCLVLQIVIKTLCLATLTPNYCLSEPKVISQVHYTTELHLLLVGSELNPCRQFIDQSYSAWETFSLEEESRKLAVNKVHFRWIEWQKDSAEYQNSPGRGGNVPVEIQQERRWTGRVADGRGTRWKEPEPVYLGKGRKHLQGF